MTWYLSIMPVQEPFDFGGGQKGRAELSFNVEVTKVFSTTLLEELVKILENAGVGTRNVNIFGSSAAYDPSDAGPYLFLTVAGGPIPINTHNQISPPAYVRPTVKVTVRGDNYGAVETMVNAAYVALSAVRNVNVVP